MAISPYLQRIRDKIGHDLLVLPGVSGIVINERREVLLHRSRDTGHWHPIGGVIDPGEDPADAVVREVQEETGVDVEPVRVLGVYTSPTVVYPNGDQVFYVVTAFVCRPVKGIPRVNDDESLEVKYFAVDHLPQLRADQHQRILHALMDSPTAFYKRRGQWNHPL